MAIVERQATRAILLSPDDRVLLMRVDYGGGDWWITPGGGAEADETPERTLRRELHEELGFTALAIGPLLYRRQVVMVLNHVQWRQSEDYYLIETETFRPDPRNAPEAARIAEFRWWSLPQMRHTGERLAPPSLMRIVLDYRDRGAPTGPIPFDDAEG